MLNRDLLIVRYKQAFVDWVNEADPHPGGHRITNEDANEDSPAYPIHEYASEEFESWLEGSAKLNSRGGRKQGGVLQATAAAQSPNARSLRSR